MPSGHDLLAAARHFHHEPYSMGPGRASCRSGVKDCSGLIYAAFTCYLGIFPSSSVSTGLETWAVRNGGRYISAAEALRTPGAGLSIWGTGAGGHIGLSVGNNSQAYETTSAEGRRVGFSPFWRNRWQRFFTWPHIHGGGGAPTPPPPPLDRANTMINVADGSREGVWIYDGVRITALQAWNLAGQGVKAISTPEIAYARGRVGQNPDTGQNDKPNAVHYTYGAQEDLARNAADEARAAKVLATATLEEVKKIVARLGV